MQLKRSMSFLLQVSLFLICIFNAGIISADKEKCTSQNSCNSNSKECGCSKLKRDKNSHEDFSEQYKYTEAANTRSNQEKEKDSFERTNQMVFLKGGMFTMGTDKPYIIRDGESPSRKVKLKPFYIDVYEVSNAEFELFVNETNYITEVKPKLAFVFVCLSV